MVYQEKCPPGVARVRAVVEETCKAIDKKLGLAPAEILSIRTDINETRKRLGGYTIRFGVEELRRYPELPTDESHVQKPPAFELVLDLEEGTEERRTIPESERNKGISYSYAAIELLELLMNSRKPVVFVDDNEIVVARAGFVFIQGMFNASNGDRFNYERIAQLYPEAVYPIAVHERMHNASEYRFRALDGLYTFRRNADGYDGVIDGIPVKGETATELIALDYLVAEHGEKQGSEYVRLLKSTRMKEQATLTKLEADLKREGARFIEISTRDRRGIDQRTQYEIPQYLAAYENPTVRRLLRLN